MLGAIRAPVGHVSFDFNFTLKRNSSDPFRDIGMLMVHAKQAYLKEIVIHDHISIVTEPGIDSTQNAKFVAKNDYHSYSIPLDIIVDNGMPGWAITLIVIGCLAVAGVGGFFAYKAYLKNKANNEPEGKKSLLEAEGEQDEEDEEDEEDDDDDDDEEDDE